jgi:hypothetical protein
MKIVDQYNVENAAKAQLRLCEHRNLPCFSPESGRCWNCDKNIYSKDGITVKEAGDKFITCCPFCHYSFLE